MDGTKRRHLRVGQRVNIVLKKDQRSGTLTEGVISRFLTKSKFHPRGIKVKLKDGQVGRVQEILDPVEEPEDVWSLINGMAERKSEEEDELGDDW